MKRSVVRFAIVSAVIALIGAGVYYTIWFRAQTPHIAVKFGVATEVTAKLQRQINDGLFFVETNDHKSDHALIIVNSNVPAVQKALGSQLGKSVHLFGIRDGIDSDDFAVLWVNGHTVQAEIDALPYFAGSFRETFQHASEKAQQCLVDKLGQDTVTAFIHNRNEPMSDDQRSQINHCLTNQ